MTIEPLLNYAGLFRRAGALALDFLLFCMVFFPATYFIKGVWLMSPQDHLWIIFDPICAVFLVIIFVYFIVFEARLGWTVGKWILKLRVVDMHGDPIAMKASLIRNLGRLIDGIPLYLTGIVCILVTRKKQRVGDMMAKTCVVVRQNRTT